MPVFDWKAFLDKEGIEYIERGANVGRGEVNIKCPFCGTSDPSHHMGLNTESGKWACWRNQDHRGISPLRLIVQLLRIPYWKARQIAGLEKGYVDPEGFDALAAQIMHREGHTRVEQLQKRFLALPEEFELVTNWGRSRMHYRYLEQVRGLGDYTQPVVREYLLCYDKAGASMPNRVIFPYLVDDVLVTWTGRAINNATIRYKDLDLETSVVAPKETLYNYDCIPGGGRILAVVEGPIDTVKLDFGGRPHGVRAVGLSTNSMSEDQIWLLEEAASQFEHVVFIMDNKSSGFSVVDSMRIKDRIGHIRNARITALPKHFKDAGEMPIPDIEAYCQHLVKEL